MHLDPLMGGELARPPVLQLEKNPTRRMMESFDGGSVRKLIMNPDRHGHDPHDPTLAHKEYLRFVRNHPCASCQAEPPNDAHHFMEGETKMGGKVSDYHTTPLCRRCHRYWHDETTLPGMSPDRARALLYRAQARLLAHWLEVF